jgi:hypothetical protein
MTKTVIIETIVFTVGGSRKEQAETLERVFVLLKEDPNVGAILEAGFEEVPI